MYRKIFKRMLNQILNSFKIFFNIKAILATVIVVALKKMILEVAIFVEIYKKNKLEGVFYFFLPNFT
jgi:hypothetical protein